VSLERLAAKGEAIGQLAAGRLRDELLARADLPPGVRAEPTDGGIALTGKALRRWMLTDPKLRNFGQ
jgi:hypothetical protein